MVLRRLPEKPPIKGFHVIYQVGGRKARFATTSQTNDLGR